MACQHNSHEDCMFCTGCGECREDLDDNDICPDCKKANAAAVEDDGQPHCSNPGGHSFVYSGTGVP